MLRTRVEEYDAEICEWGNELIRVVPFIYHRFLMNKNVRISTTESMQPFYYFLDDDSINIKYANRWDMKSLESKKIPKQNLYDAELNYAQWTPPPYKRVFSQNDIIYPSRKFKKSRPTIIISNKYNMEWDSRAINHIPLNVLSDLFDLLKKKFNVIYNRIDPQYVKKDRDTLKFTEFDDYKVLRAHPEIIDVNSLFRLNRFKGIDISTFQLTMFANADRFVNVQGGLGHFASFFGGRQLFFFERNGHKNLNGSQTRTLQEWHRHTGNAQIKVGNHISIYDHFDWISEDPIRSKEHFDADESQWKLRTELLEEQRACNKQI